MRATTTIALIAAVSLALSAGTGCQKLRARNQLNKGVQAFRLARYAEAVEFFRAATELDPEFPTARLYLATAYMSQYIPGAESPENLEMARKAHEEFMTVLEGNPNDTVAIASIASMYFHQKKWPDAEEWYTKLITVDPANKEGLYTLGVIAWTKSFQKRMDARIRLYMTPEAPGPLRDRKVREELKAELLPIIETGIGHLNEAIKVDPEYADAMAYLNLLYRERADFQDDRAGYDADTQIADGWLSKNLETKKIQAERAGRTQGGIHQESN